MPSTALLAHEPGRVASMYQPRTASSVLRIRRLNERYLWRCRERVLRNCYGRACLLPVHGITQQENEFKAFAGEQGIHGLPPKLTSSLRTIRVLFRAAYWRALRGRYALRGATSEIENSKDSRSEEHPTLRRGWVWHPRHASPCYRRSCPLPPLTLLNYPRGIAQEQSGY
jgi:hypothetical protein